jgi:DNA-binding CsgD family transcriptional regulator
LVAAVHDGNNDNAEMGVLVLAEDDSIELVNAAAQGWLAQLREPEHAHLPIVIQAVASRARRAAAGDGSGPAARARIRTASGRWLVATGSTLGAGPAGRAAVILEEARAPELAPLIADAYGLSARERSVTQLVAQGLPTTKIATVLYLSPYTVQDHLKSVFDKVGVSTRGELVARLFFDHYEPRLTSGTPVGSDGWFASTAEEEPPT